MRFNDLPISLLSENDEESNRNMRDCINTANMILIALVIINNVSLLFHLTKIVKLNGDTGKRNAPKSRSVADLLAFYVIGYMPLDVEKSVTMVSREKV